MRRWNLSHYAISSCITAAWLAGCGGSQSPITAPRAIPQNRVLPTRSDSAYYKVLHRFRGRPYGAYPHTGMINVKGTLYGTTYSGGDRYGHGAVFTISTNGRAKVLYRFKGPPDGTKPDANMIDVGGTLYGTTYGGGGEERGTVFSLTPSGVEGVLHHFLGKGFHGGHPSAALIDVAGTLYGTTRVGGFRHDGTVFSITTSGTFTELHAFGRAGDGTVPGSGSLVDVGGTLYGTTQGGGANNCGTKYRPYGCGTLFSIVPGGKEKVLYSFGSKNDDGSDPVGLIDVGGTLYGTTSSGGTYGHGTFFSISTSGTDEMVLYNFNGSDGASPNAPLLDVAGVLYGTTFGGGTYSKGTVYSMTTSGTETVLHDFGGSSGDGAYPDGGLLDVAGVLYGTTSGGGGVGCKRFGSGCGTVFALSP